MCAPSPIQWALSSAISTEATATNTPAENCCQAASETATQTTAVSTANNNNETNEKIDRCRGNHHLLVAESHRRETIEKLGPPAEIFLGGGEGSDVLWVFYDSPAAYVGYGHVESWGVEDPKLTESVFDGFPAAYDALAVNAIWIRPAGTG